MYKLYKAGFIKTTWSSEGHIGKYTEGYSSTRPGYFVYDSGKIKFESPESGLDDKGRLFMEKLVELVDKYPFATLKKDADKKGIWLILEIRDLVEPPEQITSDTRTDIVAAFAAGMVNVNRENEVKIELAQERLAQFYKFWVELEAIVDEAIAC